MKMKVQRPNIRTTLTLTVLVIIASVLTYFIATGAIRFGADTITPTVNSSVEGTYSSGTGSGQIEINSASIPVDLSQ